MLTFLLALALSPGDSVPRPSAAAAPPAVVVHRQPALPIVALRLSLAADDPPGFAGAGHLIQHLHLPALEERVARVGGRVQAVRTSDAVVYTVVGPAAELDYLAQTLLAALRAPRPQEAERLRALNALAQERGAEREIAASYVRAALRARLFPDDLPATGSDAAAALLVDAPLDRVWAGMYDPARLNVVAVGDVELADVQRAFRAVPERSDAAASEEADTVRAYAVDQPQATRAWIGRAWSAGDEDAAALTVTARLLRNRLRRSMTRSAVDVEHWWTHHGQAMALVVATPDTLLPVARRTVAGALATLRDNLDERLVRDAAAAVRRDLLFYARTPERMAEVLGAFADRGGQPDDAQRFFAALGRVTEEDVRALLEAMIAQEAAAIEVPPQRLDPGR
ncbi:MAG TPA: hypothetical protein VFQ45_16845 [Longimicrobium sp.]|nr:hypothetical protein [Longimicrobium sp.]